MSDDQQRYSVEVAGTNYDLVPQGIRASLSDDPSALWGFQVHVMDGEALRCIKTCFIGRVRVHTRAPEVLDGHMDHLGPVLHEIAVEAVTARLEAGELDDEIVFA